MMVLRLRFLKTVADGPGDEKRLSGCGDEGTSLGGSSEEGGLDLAVT